MRAFFVLLTVTLVVIATNVCPTAGRPQSADLQSRILNSGAQFVQHPQGAQSYYLPPAVHSGAQQQPQPQPQQSSSINTPPRAEQIQLQIPIETNYNNEIEEKKIVLHLPPQQYPAQTHAGFQYPQPPPRKHYKIILLRSHPAPTPAPQPVVPEIEEQTLIYVLVKKPDEPSAQELEKIQQVQQDAIKFNKPEVFFIKYKGNEVQQSVQAPAIEPTHSQAASIENIIQRQQQQQQQQQQQHPESSISNVREQGYKYDAAARVARQLNDAAEDADAIESQNSAVDTKVDEIMME